MSRACLFARADSARFAGPAAASLGAHGTSEPGDGLGGSGSWRVEAVGVLAVQGHVAVSFSWEPPQKWLADVNPHPNDARQRGPSGNSRRCVPRRQVGLFSFHPKKVLQIGVHTVASIRQWSSWRLDRLQCDIDGNQQGFFVSSINQ